MDTQPALQQFIISIHSELSDLESLDPIQMVTKLQQITNSGFQLHVIQTIRNSIQLYQKDRGIIKYVYIVDKLLKVPGWNQMIQKVIVQFFCDIFIFLLIQKCFNQIDELKIIRKLWLKTIHPKLHQTMRDFILAETTIDIDQYFKTQAITLIKNHYEKKLKLTSEEMKFHLPKTIKTSNVIYESHINKTQDETVDLNANYLISQPTTVPPYVLNPSFNVNIMRHSPEPMMRYPNQNYSDPYILTQPTQYSQKNPRQMIENDPYRMKVHLKLKKQANFPQRVSPSMDPRDPRMNINKGYARPNINPILQRQNIPFYPEKIEFVNENYKRERLYSEETRTPNSSEYMVNQVQTYPPQVNPVKKYETYEKFEMIPPVPQKKVHYNEDYLPKVQQAQRVEIREQRPKYAKILQILGGDNMYKCKQCGKGYKSMAEYQKHTADHFEERLCLRQKRKGVAKLMSLDEWTQKGSGSSLQQFKQFYITVSNLCEQNKSKAIVNMPDFQPLQLKCKLCSETFDLKFRLDQWTLSNATYCEIEGQLVPLHKTCQRALDESSEGEEY